MSAAKPFIDPTTGLFTLDAWLDHAEREARRCGRYGHSMAIVVVGVRTPSGIVDPAILNAVAEAVSTSLREHDVVGDLGDGQLAIALPETNYTELSGVGCEKCIGIKHELHPRIELHGKTCDNMERLNNSSRKSVPL